MMKNSRHRFAILMVLIALLAASKADVPQVAVSVHGSNPGMSRQAFLQTWTVVENCDPDGELVLYKQGDRVIEVVFLDAETHSVSGGSITVGEKTLTTETTKNAVRETLGEPIDVMEAPEYGAEFTEELYEVPSPFKIAVLYKAETVVKYHLFR
jgi:hypothetical protein